MSTPGIPNHMTNATERTEKRLTLTDGEGTNKTPMKKKCYRPDQLLAVNYVTTRILTKNTTGQ